MLAYLEQLLNADSLSPHGICLLWRPELIWTHVIADLSIGLSYFSIPVALGVLVWKRPDISFNWMIWCFAAFILACGTTHFFAIWTLWHPDYGVEAVIKIVTAAVSIATAIALWPLIPKALSWPSPSQLAAANAELTALIKQRDEALDALRRESAERARAEDMLRQSQKLEAIGQLTGGIAHDFNNLLTVMNMNMERIETKLRGHADAGIRKSLSNAMLAADKAAAITSRMLAFARKERLDPAHHDARQIMSELGPLFHNAVQEDHEIVFDLPPGPCPVHIDRQQFENALLNLTINARDALGGGGRIVLRAYLRGDHVYVEVEDNGDGMPDHVRARAFEPFFTTKTVGKGSGLGLSQVYGFAQQSGGSVDVRSTPGEGTTVSIILPKVQRLSEPLEA